MSEIFENIESQLSELDVLQSIYPNEDEIVIQDHLVFSMMKEYIESGGINPPGKSLPLRLNLKIDDPKCFVYVDCLVPGEYPGSKLPEISVRCDSMTRQNQRELNDDLQKFMNELIKGETCLYQVFDWVGENAKTYIQVTDDKDDTVAAVNKEEVFVFTRLWIYSHHIYNKNKRRDILEWGKELQLTGFSMPGKPGVVCAEGEDKQCEEYWRRLRNLNWKRINIAHKETVTLDDPTEDEIMGLRRFKSRLNEINFDAHQNAGRNYHMDLGKFFDYLSEHGCKEMFHMLFGVEGRSTS